MVEDFVASSLAGDDSDFVFSRRVTKAINDIQKIAGLAV
jgi:hypothetical protein